MRGFFALNAWIVLTCLLAGSPQAQFDDTQNTEIAKPHAGALDPSAAEGVTYDEEFIGGQAGEFFGESSADVADVVRKVFEDLGEPNAYIPGEESGGAFIVGVRYGKGTLVHKLEGHQPVFWKGPSIGFDIGGNSSRAFVLVYNLHETDDLFKRFPGIEGTIYVVGGVSVHYVQRGEIILAPIRIGVGLRAGANVGYLSFSRRQNWIPF